MKFLDQPITCKGFVLCLGHITANDSFVITEEDTVKDGTFSQIGFCIDGGATLYDSANTVVGTYTADNLYDFKEYYGKSYTLTTTNESGGTWFCINPLPAKKIYDMELLRENATKTIVGDGVEKTVICVYGTVTINGKILTNKQYVRVLNGKTANVEVSPGSMAIYFNDSGKTQG